MRSKALLLMIFAALTAYVSAQPNNWREDSPDGWEPLALKGEFDNFTEGSTALKIIFTETGTPYFVSDTFNVTANSAYDFSIDVLDNDPGVEVNQRIRFIDADGAGTNATSGDYSVDNADYQTYSYTGTTPATAVKAYVVIRIYDVTANWTGSGMFYLDNGSYTEDGGANLLVNGGFEDWPTPSFDEGSTLMNWKEDSPLEWVPITIEPEVAMVNHGLTAAKITFTETGTPYFVSDTFDVTANSAFDFSIDILDNDAGCEVNQRIRFIDASDAGTNETSGDYSVDNADYQTASFTGTTPATAVKAYVILRLYDVSANWTGSSTFYIDNARYTEDGGTTNLLKNASFEDWAPPSGKPEFLAFSFEGLDPAVTGVIDKLNKAVSLTVPFGTDVTALVATFELTEGASAKVGATDQVSATTPNDFTSSVTYSLTSQDGTITEDWVVTVSEVPATTGKDILSFRFAALDPPVNGVVSPGDHTVALEVPNGTALTALVPTIVLSENASSSPESGVATDFSSAVTYTVTAQDGSTQDWVVTVTVASAGKTVLFSEDFESITELPSDWVIINNDGFTQAAGEERWQDSAWVITTSNRIELTGTRVAMASSYTSDMPIDGRADDWMILPSISILDNTTLSWQAMSTTSSGNYPDDYIVLIAPALSGIAPTIAYFEEEGNYVIQVAPENWSANVGRPGEGLASYSINLKDLVTPSAADGWFNRDVWIAFVLTTDLYTNPDTGIPNGSPGGSNLAIDNIQLVNDSGSGIEGIENNGNPYRVYPNPSSGSVKLSMNIESNASAHITVLDMLGKVVFTRTDQVHSGQNLLDLDLSHLNKGVYFVKTNVAGNDKISKLIIK